MYDEFERPYLNNVHGFFFSVLFSLLQFDCICSMVNYFLHIYQQVLSHALTIYRNTVDSLQQFQNLKCQLVFFYTVKFRYFELDGTSYKLRDIQVFEISRVEYLKNK